MLVMFLILFLMTAGIVNAETTCTAKYAQTSTSCTIQAEGIAPEGSSATFSTTYQTKDQLTEDNSMTYTISGDDGKTIEAITLSMHSNKETGAGVLSVKIGNDRVAHVNAYFNAWYDGAAYSVGWKDICLPSDIPFVGEADLSIGDEEKIVVTIKGTANSLFCQSVSITWNHGSYSRDGLTADKFGTICLPKGGVVKSGATFFEIAYKDNNGVYMDEVTELEAGVPYVFQATDTKLVIAHDGTIATEPISYNGLYGTFTEILDVAAVNSDKKEYILANNQICECGSNCKVPANRAYLVLDEVPTTETPIQQGRRRVGMNVQGENQTTGLENTIVSTNEGIYDIMGRKVAEATASGFYIINGEKVFVVK